MQAARQRRCQLGGDGSIIASPWISKLITSDGAFDSRNDRCAMAPPRAPLQVLITRSNLEAGSRI
jgi:hypothetical protein